MKHEITMTEQDVREAIAQYVRRQTGSETARQAIPAGRWPRFYLDTNAWNGWVGSTSVFREAAKHYAELGDATRLLGAPRADHAAYEKYGYRVECKGEKTLRTLLEEHSVLDEALAVIAEIVEGR